MLRRGACQFVDSVSSRLLAALSVPHVGLGGSAGHAASHVRQPLGRLFHTCGLAQHVAAVPQPARVAGDTAYGMDEVQPPAGNRPQQQYGVAYTVNVKSFLLGSQLDLARLKPKFRRELR